MGCTTAERTLGWARERVTGRQRAMPGRQSSQSVVSLSCRPGQRARERERARAAARRMSQPSLAIDAAKLASALFISVDRLARFSPASSAAAVAPSDPPASISLPPTSPSLRNNDHQRCTPASPSWPGLPQLTSLPTSQASSSSAARPRSVPSRPSISLPRPNPSSLPPSHPLAPQGTRFRPLSLDTPKPLFPIAGRPMIWHQARALSQVRPPPPSPSQDAS